MNKTLYKGNIVQYTDSNGEIKQGVIVSNNSCLFFSPTFQLVPLEKNLKNGELIPNAKKEFLIDKNRINCVLGSVRRKVLNQIEKDIINHHIVKSNDIYNIGEVYLAEIPEEEGSIQCGKRPVLIVSNEVVDNKIHIIPLTTKLKKQKLPTHLTILAENTFLLKDSMALAEAEMPIEIDSLMVKLGEFNDDIMNEVFNIIKIQHNIA